MLCLDGGSGGTVGLHPRTIPDGNDISYCGGRYFYYHRQSRSEEYRSHHSDEGSRVLVIGDFEIPLALGNQRWDLRIHARYIAVVSPICLRPKSLIKRSHGLGQRYVLSVAFKSRPSLAKHDIYLSLFHNNHSV